MYYIEEILSFIYKSANFGTMSFSRADLKLFVSLCSQIDSDIALTLAQRTAVLDLLNKYQKQIKNKYPEFSLTLAKITESPCFRMPIREPIVRENFIKYDPICDFVELSHEYNNGFYCLLKKTISKSCGRWYYEPFTHMWRIAATEGNLCLLYDIITDNEHLPYSSFCIESEILDFFQQIQSIRSSNFLKEIHDPYESIIDLPDWRDIVYFFRSLEQQTSTLTFMINDYYLFRTLESKDNGLIITDNITGQTAFFQISAKILVVDSQEKFIKFYYDCVKSTNDKIDYLISSRESNNTSKLSWFEQNHVRKSIKI